MHYFSSITYFVICIITPNEFVTPGQNPDVTFCVLFEDMGDKLVKSATPGKELVGSAC